MCRSRIGLATAPFAMIHNMFTTAQLDERPKEVFADIAERSEDGLTVLSRENGRPIRRILYVNSYGGKQMLAKVKTGVLPPHHFWGCFELVRKGYEVALAEPLPD